MPRYQHVFLFYFENQDFGSVIGNTRQAPYLNSLLPHAQPAAPTSSPRSTPATPTTSRWPAAARSAFRSPTRWRTTPQYTIHARNIGDLIDAAHETWKAYLQSANGPCDDTVHGYYWDDDLPMTYFADVRDRPAYCSAHLVPLQALQTDLASAATTPSFAWIGPDDCADMEGCGIRAGDDFLAAELGAIMRSPAWRTQRSLAIITFDEDGYDHEHPAQRVATLILGSAGVRQGYVSHVRYTHYSLLRTIEGALGLGTLTANDRYAQAVNDVFGAAGQPAGLTPAQQPAVPARPARSWRASAARADRTARRPCRRGGPAGRRQQTAFVVNSARTRSRRSTWSPGTPGPPIPVGKDPQAIAITPGRRAPRTWPTPALAASPLSTRRPGRRAPPIRVGSDPQAIAITPDGRTAYVTNAGADDRHPDRPSHRPGAAAHPGRRRAAARSRSRPDGRTAFVLDWGGAAVTPIDVRYRPRRAGRSGSAATPSRSRSRPDGAPPTSPATARTRSRRSASPPAGPDRPSRPGRRRTRSPSPRTAARSSRSAATPTRSSPSARPPGRPGRPCGSGTRPRRSRSPTRAATAFVVNTISGTVTPVSVASRRAGRPIGVGAYNYPTAISLAPSGPIAVVVGTYGGQVTLINTSTDKAVATVTVGSYPVAAAIAP